MSNYDTLLYPGGELVFTDGQLATITDIRRLQHIAVQGMFDLIMAGLTWDNVNDAPRDGVLGDGLTVAVVAGLNISVSPGVGFFYDSTVTDEFPARYRPIVVSASDTSKWCLARESDPRIDVVSIAPDTDTDTSEANPTVVDGVPGSLTQDRRKFYTYAITITKGTAAAVPVAPATPSGHLKLAEVNVPATSGALVIRDCRPILQIGDRIASVPGREYHSNWVPGASTEMEVTQSATPSMVLRVAGGSVDIYGQRLRFAPQTVTVTTADATNPRIDVVTATSAGVLAVVAGTPAGSPSVPSAGSVALAQVAVAATDTTLETANITDVRQRTPYSGALLTAATVAATKMATTPWYPGLSVSAEGTPGANQFTITGQVKDSDGNALSGHKTMRVTILDMQGTQITATYAISAISVGTRFLSANPTYSALPCAGVLLTTNSTGAFTIVVDCAAGANKGAFVEFMPYGPGGSPGLCDVPAN